MSGAAFSVSAGASQYNPYTSQNFTNKPATDSGEPTTANREQQLVQQLDDRLTSRISRIREQIGGAGSPPGVGSVLDIQA